MNVEGNKMKRIILTTTMLILALMLCACADEGNFGQVSALSTPAQFPTSEPAQEQDGHSDIIDSDVTGGLYTIIADFSSGNSDGRLEYLEVDITSPLGNDVIKAMELVGHLSEWSGLDFALSAVRFLGDGITVDWSKESTLLAGLGDRVQNEEFLFFDTVSLNWFMMDSLASTLRFNFPEIEDVFYSSDGQPLEFTNPGDMAAQGLPALPVDQSYEGSTFFVAYADGRGDDFEANIDVADTGWVNVRNMLSIPPDWTYDDTKTDIEVSGFGGVDEITLIAGWWNPGYYEWLEENNLSQKDFLFDDGNLGDLFEMDGSYIWINGGMYLSFGSPELPGGYYYIYSDNIEIITSIAKTLTDPNK
jgi:hypothetical protein